MSMMMYFKLGVSKRGKKCSSCNEVVPPKGKYFSFFQWDKEKMKFPINETICLKCASEINNNEFLVYLSKLLVALRNNQKAMNEIEKEKVEF